LPFPNCTEPANLDESYRRGEKTDEDLRRATCFENYGFLSLNQNGANYKFNKKKSVTEQMEKTRNNLARI
jgi:hypothetical protein